MLPNKIQVNWPFGSGEEAKNRFSSQLGFPIGTNLATFDVQVTLMLPTKFRVNWSRGVGVVNKLLTPYDGRRTLTDHTSSP